MAVKPVKRTAQNSKPPPLKYEVIDQYTNGDNKYELRKLTKGLAIYLYSSRTKDWTMYCKIDVDKHWYTISKKSVTEEIKNESKY